MKDPDKQSALLTKEQDRAVRHGPGAACVVAGAGTGKTRTLCDRICYLVQQGRIEPRRLLVTTFTRKATAELYRRAYESLGDAARSLRITTIDALIADLARQAGNQGAAPPRRLIGEAETRVLLLESAWETFGRGRGDSRPFWAKEADGVGLVGMLEDSLRAKLAEGPERKKLIRELRLKLYQKLDAPYLQSSQIPSFADLCATVRRYLRKARELGVVDYDGLSRDFLSLLRRRKKIARVFSDLFDTILVDEFQDTSRVQGEILLLLAGRRKNIWIVGDPCQQIYEWRGAGPANLKWFAKKTGARRYYLTSNWRSTQPILDSAFTFLKSRVPDLRSQGMLKRLISRTGASEPHPVYSGNLEQALWFVKRLLADNPSLSPGDVALLSRKLDRKTIQEIEERTTKYGLVPQFQSSRADRTLERTIKQAPFWKPGEILEKLYGHPTVRGLLSRSLKGVDFSALREFRPLAVAAEATDSSLPPSSFTFREAWPALKKTQDREVGVTAAVQAKRNAIQVMTVHAAKGLEFPVVLVMKLGRSFPSSKSDEEARLTYVAVTRAKDVLILVHTKEKPRGLLAKFGRQLHPLRRNRKRERSGDIRPPAYHPTPPIIAATELDLYEECPLKFAAFHEGRFLPRWSVAQSIGSRMHKALEYLLRGGRTLQESFRAGLRDGDSALRRLPRMSEALMQKTFRQLGSDHIKSGDKALLVEERYRYIQGKAGQVEGVIDALIKRPDGSTVIREWKTAPAISAELKRKYELQARAAALGIIGQTGHPVSAVEIVPVLDPRRTISIPVDGTFSRTSESMLEQVFRDVRDRNYEPRPDRHCNSCQLKLYCPARKK